MRLETLLPLGKVDPGLRQPETSLDLDTVGDDARLLEEIGYDGVCIEETKQDAYVVMTLAAAATTKLKISTAIAMAFPRAPAVTALSAWTLQKLAKGRFTLGLGPQVRAHIERRYGLQWSAPAPWMREYVQAVRAFWHTWQTNAPLDFQGDHYKLNLMSPIFNPGPISHPEIPIHLAAVNKLMCSVAGEVADGVRPHPICSPAFIENVMLPAVRVGAEKAGRSLDHFQVAMKPLVATAANQQALEARIRDVRARLSFYVSTPAYRPAFEFHGYGDLAREMSVLAREKRWEEMPAKVDDDLLNLFAVIGTYDQIGSRLRERFGKVVTTCEFSIAVNSPQDKEILAQIVKDTHAESSDDARAKISGQKAA